MIKFGFETDLKLSFSIYYIVIFKDFQFMCII